MGVAVPGPEIRNEQTSSVLLFVVAGRRHALPLHHVEEVVRAVDVTPIPDAPATVLGVVNVRGSLVVVVDLHQRLGLRVPPVDPSNAFVLVRTPRRTAALRVDSVSGVNAYPSALLVENESMGEDLQQSIRGVVRLDDGLLVIHDVDRFLSAAEDAVLDGLLERHPGTE